MPHSAVKNWAQRSDIPNDIFAMDVLTPLPPEYAHENDGGTRTSPRGETRFLREEELVRMLGGLEAARLLVVTVPLLTLQNAGRLGEAVDDAIEMTIAQRGGAAPGIDASSDADAAMSDQLYRCRSIGHVGLAIALPSLRPLANEQGVLMVQDATCLRFLLAASLERPLVVLLDERNRSVRAYDAPRPIEDLVAGRTRIVNAERPKPPEAESTAATVKLASGEVAREITLLSSRQAAADTRGSVPTRSPTQEVRVANGNSVTPLATLQHAASLLREVSRATPLSGLERAFVEGYAPIRRVLMDNSIPSGMSRADLKTLVQRFSTSFSKAYSEAFGTFGVTGRHPDLTMQVFDLAQKIARVHGARSTQVVIVDALRWDLGQRVKERLVKLQAQRAALVEDQLLWACLPTTTDMALDVLTRGEDALRGPQRDIREATVVRGRSLDVLRRIKLGHRDVMKLDLLEGRLRDGGSAERDRLDALADEVAPLLSRFVDRAQSRALVVIAGDHGFSFGDDERVSTPPARQGGASPEEVFVPMLSFLVGGVH